MTQLPEKVGKYHIVGIAGQGNMGVVYVGYDPFADRDVAIKVCTGLDKGNEATRRMARKMFFNEAHTAGALEHPNILRVLDAGEDRGHPYIVMEYVDGGETLEPFTRPEYLLPVSKVAEFVSRTASALDYAHRRGVVHRDIKPTNLMLTPESEVKIGDFGIAHRILDDTTEVSGMMGSPRYMAPEQVNDLPISGQTDIYALGVVMYELLTGRPPFTAPTLSRLFNMIRNDAPVPPGEIRDDLPKALDSIVCCALEKDLHYRYQTAGELAGDLANLFAELRVAPSADISANERYDLLRDLHFFNEFSDDEVKEVARAANWSNLASGQRMEAGNDTAGLQLVVLSGDVEMRAGDRIMGVLGPGECFGALAGSEQGIGLRARNDALLLSVTSHQLSRLSDGAQLRFGNQFLNALLQRLGSKQATDTSTDGRNGTTH